MSTQTGPASTRRYALAALLTAALVLTGAAAQSAPAQTTVASVRNFGKINEHFYRGEQPRDADFAELKRLGIKTVIDLRKDFMRGAQAQAEQAGLRYINLPLTTKKPPTDEETEQFLKLVNDPDNWPVYVHCKGGRHRTGVLTAIYRITQDGWTADQAYDEMKTFDFESGRFLSGGGSRARLRKHVYDFYERFRQSAQGARPAPSRQ
jgi:uncharacterized protein (TIGR01244 family)